MAILAEGDPRHGTVNGYGNHACRCAECREAMRVAHSEYIARVRKTKHLIGKDVVHGTSYRYEVGCRCEQCRAAHNARSRETKARLRAQRR